MKKGGLVVYPTDTVYGLGCDPFSVKAVERLIHVKGAREKPLPILSNTLSQIERVAKISLEARVMGEKFWPGPLTLILPKKDLPEIVTFGLRSVGVRIPNNEITLMLVSLAGGLLVGTSANKTGCPPPSKACEAIDQLGDQVDLILDGGTAELKTPSTVIDFTGKEPKVLREGSLTFNEVLKALNTARADSQTRVKIQVS